MKAKTEVISLRLTPEEKRRLEYSAEKMGKSQPYILTTALNAYYKSVRKNLDGVIEE